MKLDMFGNASLSSPKTGFGMKISECRGSCGGVYRPQRISWGDNEHLYIANV